MNNVFHYQIKLIALWSAFSLGLLFHTQLGLMPLFHGVEVSASHPNEQLPLEIIFWLMLVFFVIPLFAIAITPFLKHHRGNQLNFGLTVVYTILNVIHFVMDILVQAPSYQLALMLILVLIGLMLNRVTYQWMRHRDWPTSHPPVSSIAESL